MNKRDLKRIEKLLCEERDRLIEEIGKLEGAVLKRTQKESSGDLSAYTIHMADLGTDAIEREKDIQVASAEGRRLQAIREALERIREEEFGVCESCDQKIDVRRLLVVPHTRYCLKCQERADRRPQG